MYLFLSVAEKMKEHSLCHVPDMNKHLVAFNCYYSKI